MWRKRPRCPLLRLFRRRVSVTGMQCCLFGYLYVLLSCVSASPALTVVTNLSLSSCGWHQRFADWEGLSSHEGEQRQTDKGQPNLHGHQRSQDSHANCGCGFLSFTITSASHLFTGSAGPCIQYNLWRRGVQPEFHSLIQDRCKMALISLYVAVHLPECCGVPVFDPVLWVFLSSACGRTAWTFSWAGTWAASACAVNWRSCSPWRSSCACWTWRTCPSPTRPRPCPTHRATSTSATTSVRPSSSVTQRSTQQDSVEEGASSVYCFQTAFLVKDYKWLGLSE